MVFKFSSGKLVVYQQSNLKQLTKFLIYLKSSFNQDSAELNIWPYCPYKRMIFYIYQWMNKFLLTFSNDFSSEAPEPILLKFHMEPP